MSLPKRLILLAALLGVVAYAVVFTSGKERIIRDGRLVLLELAPTDPRSVLQGDFMDLRYAIGRDLSPADLPVRGYLVFTPDEEGIGRFVRIQESLSPLAPDEQLIRFRRRRAGAVRNGSLRIGSESYFFEEGQEGRFARAQYGGLRIDGKGNAVLVGLYDSARQRIAD